MARPKKNVLVNTKSKAAEKKPEAENKLTEEKKPVEKAMSEAETKPEAKEATAKVTVPEEKTTVRKTAAKKPSVKKAAEPVSTVYVQYLGKEYSDKKLLELAKASYLALGNKEEDIKTLDIYVKPEENTAYYAVNGVGSDEYKIEL